MARLDVDLLFRRFVRLGVDDPVRDASTVSKNRVRRLEGDATAAFAAAIVAHPKVRRLISTEHFCVGGTLIEAWASMTSCRPKAEGKPRQTTAPRRPARAAIPRSTSAASVARTRRTPPPPIRTPAGSARAAAPGWCSASWSMRRWRTAGARRRRRVDPRHRHCRAPRRAGDARGRRPRAWPPRHPRRSSLQPDATLQAHPSVAAISRETCVGDGRDGRAQPAGHRTRSLGQPVRSGGPETTLRRGRAPPASGRGSRASCRQ